MIELNSWMNQFIEVLGETFAERIYFVGLQGSYARGEATETSDIDLVVILDELTEKDIELYNLILDKMPNRELICGFISGEKELLNWEPSDLFQFYYDTKPIVGSLDALLPLLDQSAIQRAIKIGVCNIYHGCVHNMLHEKDGEILIGLYKAATFVIQAISFLQTGEYCSKLINLRAMISEEEKMIVDTFLSLKSGGAVEFTKMSELLFHFSKFWIENSAIQNL